MFQTFERLHIAHYIALWFYGVLLGVLGGAAINYVNCLVSPEYFYFFFYLSSGITNSSTMMNAVVQGILEGTVYSLLMATVFTTYIFVVSQSRARFKFTAPYLLKMLAVSLVCWGIGAFNGVIVALLFPNFMSATAFRVNSILRLRFLAVGGSIYGVYIGCILGLVMGCIWFKKDWSAKVKAEFQLEPLP